jgi:tetratricopeptide (TPR) repeat protein
MKATRISVLLFAGVALALVGGCKPKPKPVTELQRKEAEHLAAEAGFALTIRDWPRADSLLSKAVQIVPDNGMYWLSLGSTRVRAGNKAGAKEAYQGALKAFEREANTDAGRKDPDPWLKQMQVLALMGRVEDARKVLEKTAKQFPENRSVRAFIDSKQFDKMIADPAFKQGAL